MDMTAETAATIRRRRLEAGLSIRELAEIVGCRIGAIQSIENSGDLGNWPLRLIARLCQALGLDWNDIDEPRGLNDVQTSDVQRLGAELVRTGRLRHLDVQAAGLADALPTLNEHLAVAGIALATGLKGELTLIAADGPAPIPRLFDDVPDRLANGSLTKPERQVVMSVIAENLDVQRLSTAKSRALAALLRAGLISTREGQHVVDGSLAQALGGSPNSESVPATDPIVA